MQSVRSGSTSNTEPDSDICLCSWVSCDLDKVTAKHREHFENIKTLGAVVTNSLQQNPSCKADRSSASEEISRILRGLIV